MRDKGVLRRSDRFGKVSFGAVAIRALAEDYTPLSMIQSRMHVDQGCRDEVLHAADVVKIGRLVLLPKGRTLALMRGKQDRASSPSTDCRTKHPPIFAQNIRRIVGWVRKRRLLECAQRIVYHVILIYRSSGV